MGMDTFHYPRLFQTFSNLALGTSILKICGVCTKKAQSRKTSNEIVINPGDQVSELFPVVFLAHSREGAILKAWRKKGV